jgi:hypothetical protein
LSPRAGGIDYGAAHDLTFLVEMVLANGRDANATAEYDIGLPVASAPWLSESAIIDEMLAILLRRSAMIVHPDLRMSPRN